MDADAKPLASVGALRGRDALVKQSAPVDADAKPLANADALRERDANAIILMDVTAAPIMKHAFLPAKSAIGDRHTASIKDPTAVSIVIAL